MRKLIWLELRNIFFPMAMTFSLFFAYDLIAKGTVAAGVFLPLFGSWLPGFAIAFSRSHWYLSLPVSRKKVAIVLLAQNALAALFSAIICYFLALIETNFFLFHSQFDPSVQQISSLTILGFALSTPLLFRSGIMSVGVHRSAARSNRLLIYFCAIMLAFGYLVIGQNIFSDPLAVYATFLFVPVMLLLSINAQVVLPWHNLRPLKRIAYGSYLAALIVLLSMIEGFVHFGAPNSDATQTSLRVIHRFPAMISEARATELFLNSQAGPQPVMASRAVKIRDNITNAQWVERTSKCKNSGCVDLSSAVIDLENLEKDQLAENFKTLLTLCRFKQNTGGYAVCSGVKPSSNKLDAWIDTLRKKNVLDDWLKSDIPAEQIVAIKGLQMYQTAEQARRIAVLTHSADPLVISTAMRAQILHDGIAELKGSCDEAKNKNEQICQFRSWGPSYWF